MFKGTHGSLTWTFGLTCIPILNKIGYKFIIHFLCMIFIFSYRGLWSLTTP